MTHFSHFYSLLIVLFPYTLLLATSYWLSISREKLLVYPWHTVLLEIVGCNHRVNKYCSSGEKLVVLWDCRRTLLTNSLLVPQADRQKNEQKMHHTMSKFSVHKCELLSSTVNSSEM